MILRSFLSLAALLVASLAGSASAQTLIWSLPTEDAAMVRFEGTYQTGQERPNSTAGKLELKWRSELTIKSLGKQMLDIDGKQVACRWMEFKTTIKPEDLEKQSGPSATKIYKVLVREDQILGKTVDGDGHPVMFLPIEKGYRKIATDRDAVPMTEPVLAVYPNVAPLTYYPDLKPESDQAEELMLAGDVGKAVSTHLNKGSRVLESDTSRSTNTAELWLTKDVPFGVAKMKVTVTREEKDSTAPADEFKPASDVAVELTVVEIGGADKATSDLPDAQ